MRNGRKLGVGECQLAPLGRSMVEKNLPLCRFLAFKASRACPRLIRPPLNDLYQEAYRGLIDAVIRFDESKSSELGPYASLWIRKRLSEALWRWRRLTSLDDDVEWRAPDGAWPAEEIAELREAIDRLAEPGRTVMRHRFAGASRGEIADRTGLKEFEVRRLQLDAMDQLRRWLVPSRGGTP